MQSKETVSAGGAPKSSKRILETAFNRYELLNVKGEGGAGQVWSASDTACTAVAIKILKAAGANTERRKRFKNEITFSERATHPNVVRVLDHGVTVEGKANVPFFVMPLFGGSFRAILSSKVDFAKRLKYFDQILSGVEAAHLQGVTHRDLKPENILHDDNNDRLIVADFGIAHFTDEELFTAVETSPHARLANFLYAAPEQRIRGGRTDNRTDIYALGLMLNELFTGDVPHGEGYKRVVDTSPEYAWIDEIVAQMIQSDPARRPQAIDQIKMLLIASKQEYVERQRLSEIQQTVVPIGEEDDPLALVGPRIIGADWNKGQLSLTFDRIINQGWVTGLQNMGSHTSVWGVGPETFSFSGSRASVHVSEDDIQRVIDHFKQWIPNATQAYRSARKRMREEAANRERSRLQQEQQEIERRRRVLASIKI